MVCKICVKVCGKQKFVISKILGICSKCIKNFPEKAEIFIKKAYKETRKVFNLPSFPLSYCKHFTCAWICRRGREKERTLPFFVFGAKIWI